MSTKLAIILCASIFFASTLVECGATLEGKELQRRVHAAKKSVEDRIQQIRDKVYTLGAQPSLINFEIIQTLKENVTIHMGKVRDLMNRNSRFQREVNNGTECMRHYDEYNALAASVITMLDSCVSSVALTTFESFGKTITAATEFVSKVQSVEAWAPDCEGFWCGFIDGAITSSANKILQSLDEALDDCTSLADGSSVREAVRTETDYYDFLGGEDAFWNEIINCMTASAPSPTPAA